MTMFCFWCQEGFLPRYMEEKGFVWVHLKCFTELNDIRMDYEGIKEILEAKEKSEPVERFLKRMEEFTEKWDELMNDLKWMQKEGGRKKDGY